MTAHSDDRSYDVRSMDLPPLTGAKLRLAVALLDSPSRHLLMPRLLREAGVTWLRSQVFDETPTGAPLHPARGSGGEAPAETRDAKPAGEGFRFSTVHDYARAYREKTTSPDEVAERVYREIEAGNAASPPLNAVIAVNRDDLLRQAAASARRIREGKVLGIFDGVPVAVKDELDMVPYPTTAGTAFLGKHPAATDATVVARLRAAGALLVGKTNMHEIGLVSPQETRRRRVERNLPSGPPRGRAGRPSRGARGA